MLDSEFIIEVSVENIFINYNLKFINSLNLNLYYLLIKKLKYSSINSFHCPGMILFSSIACITGTNRFIFLSAQ